MCACACTCVCACAGVCERACAGVCERACACECAGVFCLVQQLVESHQSISHTGVSRKCVSTKGYQREKPFIME